MNKLDRCPTCGAPVVRKYYYAPDGRPNKDPSGPSVTKIVVYLAIALLALYGMLQMLRDIGVIDG